MGHPSSSASAPSPGFLCFTLWLELTPEQAQRFCEALQACGERETKALLYQLERVGNRRTFATQERIIEDFARGVGHPQRLIAILERLHTLGLLSRVEASAIESRILDRCQADGRWRNRQQEKR